MSSAQIAKLGSRVGQWLYERPQGDKDRVTLTREQVRLVVYALVVKPHAGRPGSVAHRDRQIALLYHVLSTSIPRRRGQKAAAVLACMQTWHVEEKTVQRANKKYGSMIAEMQLDTNST
jgi:hypothetical protein